MHTTEMKMLRWIQGKTWKDRIRNEKFRRDALFKPITTYVTQKRLFVVWPCDDEERRNEPCKASNNNEGGREETSRKAQTEVDGQGAERFETTPARYKARTEPNGEMQSWRSTPPGIGSAKVSKGEHPGNESSLIRTHISLH